MVVRCPRFNCAFILAIAFIADTSPAAAQAPANEPTLESRMSRLCTELERQREAMHVPGLAIAIVKDDKVILSRGFGQRDVEQNLPVTDETLFAIGSSSKAFTAALIGTLVDQGKMSWDEPLRTYLPDFHLKDPKADEAVTIRDALCHRSGLSRTDLLWASGEASRQEILAAIANAEPTEPFREKFQYNNVLFLAAGQAAGAAANSDWDSLIAERLFKPLGMNRSTTRISDAQRDPQLAKGYSWDDEKHAFEHVPMRKLDSIAPAGAINSCVKEMAQWIRLQLGRGEIDGARLLSSAAIEETWSPQIEVADGTHYGLGWFIHKWNDKRVVQHGGNIDGFSSMVAMLPDDHVGFILLANVSHTPLQSVAMTTVFDHLLGEVKEGQAVDPAQVQPYLGKYRFDLMKVDLTVLIRNGRLAVDVPGQMVFELKPPDEAGKWAFDFPQPIAVSFVKNGRDEVTAMKLHQAGMEFELPREGIEPELEVDLAQVQPLLGAYRSDKLKNDVKVVIHNGRLAVDVPHQMIFELHSPNEEGKWVCRATDTLAVRFNRDAEGNVESMSVFQKGVEDVQPRVSDAADAKLPDAEEVLDLMEAAYGTAKVDSLGNVKMSGTIDFANQGIQGTFTMLSRGPDRFMQRFDLEKYGYIAMGLNGEKGWSDSLFHGYDELSGKYMDQLRLQHPLLPAASMRGFFTSRKLTGAQDVDGQRCYAVRLAAGEDIECTLYIDAQSHLVRKMEYRQWHKGIGALPQTVTFHDHREINGVTVPFRAEADSLATGRMIVLIENIEPNVQLPDGAFEHRAAETRQP